MADVLGEIRQAIDASGLGPTEIARGAGISHSQIVRLMSSERGMSVANLEKVTEFLGLEIVVKPKRKERK